MSGGIFFQYIECANVCLRDKVNCDGFTMSGSDCHLGSPSRSESVVSSPQSNEANFYMAKGMPVDGQGYFSILI